MLWVPALGLPPGPLPVQPMDLWMLPGWLLLLGHLTRLPGALLWVLGPGLAALALSWATMGGQPLILGWTLGCALPFVALIALVASDPAARSSLLLGFLTGAGASALLFLAQILWGAEALDFRSNPAFRLPPQYGRGFALMPEVSTYAVHALMALAATLVLLLHRLPSAVRRALWGLVLLLGITLPFTRSSSVLLLLPPFAMLALMLTRRFDRNTVLLAGIGAGILALVLWGFTSFFYAERLSNAAAGRSAAMRLASILGGLSPLGSGELFGLGIGENAAVTHRAYEAAQHYGLSFGSLPQGVNSQIIGRIFEEGWPALLHLALAAALLARARRGLPTAGARALFMMGVAGFAMALLVVGYRGIYTTWLWLGLAAGLAMPPAAVPRSPPLNQPLKRA
ncbi:hypothetical protein [Brevirhabdus sp.]|uniref:hypothetical protein n=1 Tax=Brevirhabdus sp. TaxID=2004514 RepID=UPI0040580B89